MNEQILYQHMQVIDKEQSKCTYCGLCMEVCPSYKEAQREDRGPRGKIQLASQYLKGNVPLDSTTLNTFDDCESCTACETACPSDVKIGSLINSVQSIRKITNPSTSG